SQDLCVQGRGGLRLPTLARHLRMLVIVFGVACGAPGLLHVGVDHGNDRVVRDPALAWTIIVQNVTKPKLALLHQKLPKEPRWRGKELRKARLILAELLYGRQAGRQNYP